MIVQEVEIFEKVKTIIANVLEIDKNEIEPDSSLIDDMGLESVDFIDIAAKIEAVFDINIAEGELWNLGGTFLDNRIIKKGKITKRGTELLKQKIPCQDFQEIKPGTNIVDIFSLFNVKMIVDFLAYKLKKKSQEFNGEIHENPCH